MKDIYKVSFAQIIGLILNKDNNDKVNIKYGT